MLVDAARSISDYHTLLFSSTRLAMSLLFLLDK